ncbi:hypothetical protein JCM10207_000800 [Rhodosporidiobolus poonsookiae]
MSFIKRLFASELTANEKPKWFFWYPPGSDARTKKFLFKVDAAVITYGCLSYWVKYHTNITNAYVSGMREDIGITPKQYTMALTLFTVGTTIAMIPSNYIITIVPPRIFLPAAEFLWGILTLVMFKAKNHTTIWALRFLIGFLEGTAFVGMIYCFGSWYTKRELGKRLAIFACCAYLGSMFSGYMTAAIYKNMDGTNGLHGWQWLFIIDAIITFAVAGFGFAFFPDTPATTKAWWLTAEEKQFAVDRLLPEGRGTEFNAGGLSVFKRLFTRHWTLLVFCWIGWSNTLGKYIGTVFSLYLKANPSRWSLYQINNIPTSSGGFNIAAMLVTGWLVDMTGRRYAIIFTCLSIQIIGTILYLAFDIGVGGQIAAMLLGSLDGPTSPIIMTWANLLLGGDVQRRALTIASMNCLGSAVSSIVTNYGYDATTAPKFPKGIGLSLGFVLFELVCVTTLRWVELSTRETRDADANSDKLEGGAGSVEDKKDADSLEGVVPVATKLFIIEAIITFIVAGSGFAFITDTPATTKI